MTVRFRPRAQVSTTIVLTRQLIIQAHKHFLFKPRHPWIEDNEGDFLLEINKSNLVRVYDLRNIEDFVVPFENLYHALKPGLLPCAPFFIGDDQTL